MQLQLQLQTASDGNPIKRFVYSKLHESACGHRNKDVAGVLMTNECPIVYLSKCRRAGWKEVK